MRGVQVKKNVWLVVLTMLLVSGCVQQNKTVESKFDERLTEGNPTEMNISELTDFTWDKAFLFDPYTPEESMNDRLGVNYKDKSNISIRDDIFLLVFMADGKIVQYAELARAKNNYSIGMKKYLTPSNDQLLILQ